MFNDDDQVHLITASISVQIPSCRIFYIPCSLFFQFRHLVCIKDLIFILRWDLFSALRKILHVHSTLEFAKIYRLLSTRSQNGPEILLYQFENELNFDYWQQNFVSLINFFYHQFMLYENLIYMWKSHVYKIFTLLLQLLTKGTGSSWRKSRDWFMGAVWEISFSKWCKSSYRYCCKGSQYVWGFLSSIDESSHLIQKYWKTVRLWFMFTLVECMFTFAEICQRISFTCSQSRKQVLYHGPVGPSSFHTFETKQICWDSEKQSDARIWDTSEHSRMLYWLSYFGSRDIIFNLSYNNK